MPSQVRVRHDGHALHGTVHWEYIDTGRPRSLVRYVLPAASSSAASTGPTSSLRRRDRGPGRHHPDGHQLAQEAAGQPGVLDAIAARPTVARISARRLDEMADLLEGIEGIWRRRES